ncbi:hypothetical protein GUITHDRAFT_151221, partial [Guillardia theta CCMP2712]
MDADRGIELLAPKVMNWELAFLLEDDNSIWDNRQLLWKWEITVSRVCEKQKDADNKSRFNTGVIVEEQHARGVKSLDAAELFLQQGHNLYNSKDYCEAIEAFKKASSWYFRKGERSKSEIAKAWVRRAKVALIERNVSSCLQDVGSCFCVCELTRYLRIYDLTVKRFGNAQMAWTATRDKELSFQKGDV